jgi:hypothetical protein
MSKYLSSCRIIRPLHAGICLFRPFNLRFRCLCGRKARLRANRRSFMIIYCTNSPFRSMYGNQLNETIPRRTQSSAAIKNKFSNALACLRILLDFPEEVR